MLVLRDQLGEAYRDIRAASSPASPVLLFVSAECDSVCACHILTSLLRMDHIQYKVIPVASYEDLQDAGQTLPNSVRSVIMVNCGSGVDLEQLFKADDPGRAELHIYILDSHRPYHLSNVRQDNHFVVCLDSSTEHPTFPSDDNLSSDDDDDHVNRRLLADRRRRVAEHYSGSFYDVSAAALAYDLAQQLSKDDNDLLWSAIVGLTDQWLYQRISKWTYQNELDVFMQEVFAKNVPESNDANGDESAAPDEAQVQVPVEGTISFETQEFMFVMLRHWNLFDSMFHTRSVATRLKVWRDMGRQHLNLILAKLGIPKQESRSPYLLMRADCKDRLRKELDKYAQEYGLEQSDLFLPSFTRRYEDGLIVSASDMVHVVTALLECNQSADGLNSWEANFWRSHDSLRFGSTKLTKRGLELAINLQRKVAHHGHALLARKAITSTGKYRLCLLDRSEQYSLFARPLALTQLALFLIDSYEAMLIEQSTTQKKRMRTGSGSALNRKVKLLPFVLCSYIEERGSYLVIGIPRSQASVGMQRNSFSIGFTDAAVLTKARARQDGFEASIVEIAKEDLKPFLETLVNHLI